MENHVCVSDEQEESSSKRQKVENRSPALVKADEAIASNAFDVDAWHAIIVEAHSRPIDQARDLWERVLARFPTAARCWRAYAEAELQANNFGIVECFI
jgi:cleavage stimulation factor subunit 3